MGWSQDYPASQETSSSELPLPRGFKSIQHILDTEDKLLKQSHLVNVIGIVKDYQPPIQTKGQDWKCAITLVDYSTRNEYSHGIKLMIFWPIERMPHITGVADVVMLRNVKVQMWSGYVSLISNFRSEIDVYAAKTMPSWPLKPSGAILKKPSTKSGLISPAESSYAAWLFSRFDRRHLPASKEFEESVRRAGNIKDKYSLLKDVQIARFYDLIGEVIRIYDRDGVVTMHISDYTAHSLFFNYAYDGVKGRFSGRDDEFGHIKLKRNVENMWPGPYGKLSLQLTAYDAHADFIRANVKVTDWVLLKNVHIRMGKSGCCIEGILHGDKDACEGKVQVQIIHPSRDAEMHDTRWKEAVRRKRDYWSKFKRQKQDLEDTTNSNGKRNSAAEGAQNQNSKKRRKEKRAAAEAMAAVLGQKSDGALGLNANVKCNYHNKDPIPVLQILQSNRRATRSKNDVEYTLPFINVNFRSTVRVIDFFPDDLKDFSIGQRVTEYDILSDYSGGEDTDPREDTGQFRAGTRYDDEKAWSWRFALLVEDASRKATEDSERMWLLVDNLEGQMLLTMDAVNLRQDKAALAHLREQLFKLWGNLEEKKREFIKSQTAKVLESSLPSIDTEPHASIAKFPAKPGDSLPPDSDDDSSPSSQQAISKVVALSERHLNTTPKPGGLKQGVKVEQNILKITDLTISNKGFNCCIRQYGIKVPEESVERADAGPGLRWQRQYGIFGTTIM